MRSRELSSQMVAKILKHERAEKFHFLNFIVKNQKPLLLTTLNKQGFTLLINKLRFSMCQEAGYFNKANQRYSFLFSFEIIA